MAPGCKFWIDRVGVNAKRQCLVAYNTNFDRESAAFKSWDFRCSTSSFLLQQFLSLIPPSNFSISHPSSVDPEMPADDPQPYDSQSRLWARQQPVYSYPQPSEDGSHLGPPSSAPEHSSNIGLSSYDYGPSYDQISQSSSLVPSSAQYPPADSSQVPYAPYSNTCYSDNQQPSHDYFTDSQHAFGPRVPAMTNPSYPTTPGSSAYTSQPFPRQLSELSQARDYGAQVSVPTVTTPDDGTQAFSAFDAAYYHTQTSPMSNKRPRPEDQEEDVGDTTDQTRGHSLQLSAAEKLKRACARCRGLKVCRVVLLIPPSFENLWIGSLSL